MTLGHVSPTLPLRSSQVVCLVPSEHPVFDTFNAEHLFDYFGTKTHPKQFHDKFRKRWQKKYRGQKNAADPVAY